jgi:hypothetical protein
MTDNPLLRKSKPESCRPCTSHAFDDAQKAEDDWEIARLWNTCRVMESTAKVMQFDKTSGQMTDIAFLRKSKPKSCRSCIIHAFDDARNAENDFERFVDRLVCRAIGYAAKTMQIR